MFGESGFHKKAMLLVRAPGSRLFQTSSPKWVDSKPAGSESSKAGAEVGISSQPPKPETMAERMPGGPRGVPTAIDKKFLVWSGMFKSKEEIPKHLDGNVIHRARSWGRIRINLCFLVLAAMSGGFMVYSGKKAQARGESVDQQNLDWHRRMNEEHKQQTGSQK